MVSLKAKSLRGELCLTGDTLCLTDETLMGYSIP